MQDYSHQHYHSGVADFAPQQVYDDSWQQVHHHCQAHEDRLFQAHPGRYRKPPVVRKPQMVVSINLTNAPEARLVADPVVAGLVTG